MGRSNEGSTTHMNIIGTGQSIVTGFGAEVEPLDLIEEFTAGGLASRDALDSFLADFRVENDTDREDLAYYKNLLRRMPRELGARKSTVSAPVAVVVAELESADDTSGYEADDVMADWTAADFESYQVLAELGTTDPVAAVIRARRPRAKQHDVRGSVQVISTVVAEMEAAA